MIIRLTGLVNSIKPLQYHIEINEIEKGASKSIDWLPLMAILISILTFIYTWHNNKKLRQKSINDDYWLRSVIFPNIIDPIMKIGHESTEMFRASSGLADFYDSYFLNEMNKLRDRLVVLRVIDETIYEKADSLIDKIDDDLNSVSNASQLSAVYGGFIKDVTSLLKEVQYDI